MALQANWTKENIEALSTLRLRALRKNAERAKDQRVLDLCDEAARLRSKKAKASAKEPEAVNDAAEQ